MFAESHRHLRDPRSLVINISKREFCHSSYLSLSSIDCMAEVSLRLAAGTPALLPLGDETYAFKHGVLKSCNTGSSIQTLQPSAKDLLVFSFGILAFAPYGGPQTSKRLHKWPKKDPNHRFHSLADLL